MILDEEQELHVKAMANEPTKAALLVGDTGVGKTLMGIELIKALGTEVNLIVAPPNTLTGWRDTAKEQGVTLPFKHITSDHKEHFDALRKHVPGIYFISRQFFALSGTDLDPQPKKVKGHPHLQLFWKVPRYYVGDQRVVLDDKHKPVKADENGEMMWTEGRDALWSWGWVQPGLTIYDEVQAVSNRYSQGFTCLRQIKTGYRVAASATPNGNKFKGIWPVARWLWPKAIDPKTGELYVDNAESRWAAKWAEMGENKYTWSGKEVRGEKNPGAFVNSLPCFVRMEAVRTPVELRKCYVDLTPKQRTLYEEMQVDMLTWLDEHPLVADIPIVQRARLRQITLGEVSFNDDGEVDFADDCESSKLDALDKIVNKHHPGEPVFILTDSAKFARVAARRLGPLARAWTGQQSAKQREEIKAAFGGPDVRFIVAVIPAVAEGLDGLQRVCNVEVWLSESPSGFMNQQAEGRVNRRGQEAKLIYRYKIMATGTDDDGTFENLVAQRAANHASMTKEA